MARLMARLAHILSADFPGSEATLNVNRAAARLEGVLVWGGFNGLDAFDRAQKVQDALRASLTLDDQRRVLSLIPLTPDEYAAQNAFRVASRAQQASQLRALLTVAVPDTASSVQDAQGAKCPFTRLLDLTLGWAEYVERDEDEHPDSVKSEELQDAYQVDTRLLPLLLGKVKPRSILDATIV